jgi:hypothetical protein
MGVHKFEDLASVLAGRAKEVARLTNGIAQEAIVQAGHYVCSETPVDKGVARSNWIASKNERVEAQIPAYAPGEKLGNVEAANLEAASAQHRAVAETFDVEAGDTTLHITNSLPYIDILNSTDYSPQADPGFFERALPYASTKLRGMWKLKE